MKVKYDYYPADPELIDAPIQLDKYPNSRFVGNLFRYTGGWFHYGLINIMDVYICQGTLILRDTNEAYPSAGLKVRSQLDIHRIMSSRYDDLRIWKEIFKYIEFHNEALRPKPGVKKKF